LQLNSSNFITPVQLSSSNFVKQLSLNSSNFITQTQLNLSNFVNQTSLNSLNASNITTGTLIVARGGTGATTLAAGQLLIGNTTSALIQSSNLLWDSTNNRLGIGITSLANILSKLTINDIVVDRNGVDHSESPLTVTHPTATSSSVLNDPKTVLHLCRQGTNSQAHGAKASFKLCRWENNATNSRTRLDITLAHASYDDVSIMSLESDGSVGIGITNPTNKLHIIHSSTATNADATGGAGLYVFNPTNTANHNSIISNRIAGTIANKVIYSMDVSSGYGWSMYIQGNDTTNKLLRFHSSWDATGGTDRLVINGANGNVGIGTIDPIASVDILKETAVATTADLLNMRFDGNWGLKLQQNYTAVGNIQYTFLHRYNAVNYNSLTFKAGNVGIITTNPSYPLDVTGDINISGNFKINGTIFTGSSPSQWITSSTNIYYNTGNVGIGTTTTSSDDANATFALPNARLYVRGAATAGATTDIVFRGGLEGNNNGKVKVWLANDAGHSSYIQSEHTSSGNTQLTFGTASGNVLPVERMRIDNAGNVGIGITDPANKLHIIHSSTALIPDTAGGIGLYVSNPTNTANHNSIISNRIAGSLANKVIYSMDVSGAYGWSMYMQGNDTTNKSLRFNSSWDATNGTDRIVINGANGNVGIGPGNPNYKLDVSGDINITGYFRVNGVLFTGSSPSQWTTSGTTIYYNAGNVGIGTTTPVYKCHIKCTYDQIATGLHLDASDTTNPNLYALTLYPYVVGGGAVGWRFRTQNQNGGTRTPLGFRHDGTVDIAGNLVVNGTSSYIDQVLQIGNINNYNGGNITKLRVWASDSTGWAATFKHPNDSQGVAISYDGLNAMGVNTNQDIFLRSRGVGQVKLVANNAICVTCHNSYTAIGDFTPSYKLDVGSGYGWPGTINTTYFSYFTGTSLANTYNNAYSYAVSCKITGSIWVTSYFISSSDIRIKEEIEDINDNVALDMILSIEPKTYKYIDKMERGDKKVYGFIAQQIKQVIPEAVKIEKAYIPNIMLLADYNNCIITLPSQPTKTTIKINDKLKCFDNINNIIEVEVIEIIDELTFKIKELEKPYTDSQIFIYGTFIDDFHTIDKSYIFTINVCATQELHKQIEQQNAIITSHEKKIKDLENTISNIMSRLYSLESH
jgi:hypothetical protein